MAAPEARARKTPQMTLAQVRGFIGALGTAYPDAQTELDAESPFHLLCAVVHVRADHRRRREQGRAHPVRRRPHPGRHGRAGAEGVAPHIRSIGLWQAKSKNVVELSRLLLERHGGEVPGDREALEALPGVGRKTANVVLNVAFGHSTMAVDTHVFRLGNRTGLAPGKTVRAVEDGLVRRIPKDVLRPAHHWLILHGRYVCKARRPECWRCVARDWCRMPAKVAGPASSQGLPQEPASEPAPDLSGTAVAAS